MTHERRHLGFGENEIGRRLATDPASRPRLAAIRAEFDPLVLGSFTPETEADGGR